MVVGYTLSVTLFANRRVTLRHQNRTSMRAQQSITKLLAKLLPASITTLPQTMSRLNAGAMTSPYAVVCHYCRGSRIWIDNTRLFLQPPTTTRVTSSVVVKQIVLFTMLQSYLGIPEEWDFIHYGVVNKVEWMAVIKSRNEWLSYMSRGGYHPGTPSTKWLDVGIQVTTNSA